MYLNYMIYVPDPDAAIGNLSLVYATHILMTRGEGGIHPDVYKYGRDRAFIFHNVTDEGVLEMKGFINAFIHLRFPEIGDIMRKCIQPTIQMQKMIDTHWDVVKDCIAGFHIRRGTSAEDSSKFARVPFASDEAVESMIQTALNIDQPVFIMSDSVSTREHFLKSVPKAISLNLEIGFTASEFSQETENPVEEDLDIKMNSILEWFIMSKMPKIYTTMGGVCGRNVPEGTTEGLSSTFGYSSALYGGKIPHYVFNDGHTFYPDGTVNSPRLAWSDLDTGKYIVLKNPTKEKIVDLRKTHGMWKIVVDPDICRERGLHEWCEERENVEFELPSKVKEVINIE